MMRRLTMLLLMGATAQAHATPVSFVGAADAVGGSKADTTIQIQLVDSAGRQIGAVRTTDGAPVTTSAQFSYDASEDAWTNAAGTSLGADPLELDLAGQDILARPDAAATYYRVRIRQPDQSGFIASYDVQVADGDDAVTFYSLLSAEAVSAADIAAGRLVPAGGDNGQLLAKASGDDFDYEWVTAAGTGDMLATTYDPTGVAGDAFAWANFTGTPTTLAGYGITDAATSAQGANADTAYGWGNHAGAGYLTSETDDQTAAEVSVAATPSHYSAATADVEAHLSGLDTALGSLGGGHDAVTVTDGTTIDLTLTGQSLTAEIIEAAVEAILDLQDLQGAVTDAQVPNDITIDLATTATTALAGDSATAFFSSGTIEAARLPDLSATYEPAGLVTAPTTPTDTCTAGQRAWSSPYLYTCVAANTWVRVTPERTW